MPLFDFKCVSCQKVTEELFKVNIEIPHNIECEFCGDISNKQIAIHADMNRMWAGQAGTGGGVNGYFDRGLGCRVHSSWEADKIAESRGLVRESDYAPHFVKDFTDDRTEKVAAQDKVNDTYQDNIKKFGGDKVKAITETFDAKACLNDTTTTGY